MKSHSHQSPEPTWEMVELQAKLMGCEVTHFNTLSGADGGGYPITIVAPLGKKFGGTGTFMSYVCFERHELHRMMLCLSFIVDEREF